MTTCPTCKQQLPEKKKMTPYQLMEAYHALPDSEKVEVLDYVCGLLSGSNSTSQTSYTVTAMAERLDVEIDGEIDDEDLENSF